MKYAVKILIGLAAAMLPVSPASAKSELESAHDLLRAGQPEQALELVNPIIAEAQRGAAKDAGAMCPGIAVAVLQQFMRADDPDVQITVTNDWCDAMFVKGYALIELKRPAEAAQVLETLVGHDPNNPNYLAEYAVALRSTGQLDSALKMYQRAGKAASRLDNKQAADHWRAVALRGEGYVYIELQRWDDAVKAYKRSQKYEPNDEIARSELKFIEENRPR